MGLRINTNVTALSALRNLKNNDLNQARSLERLSTGLRINRGSDDPSGLVISEKLRSQLSSLNQAVDNAQNASNMISVADSGLQQISDLLVQIQSSVEFALNTGGSTPEQIAAEQNAVDQALEAIDRIAKTTRFADRNLLDGDSEYLITAQPSTQFRDLDITKVSFPTGVTDRDFTVTMKTIPMRAELRISGADAAEDVNIIAVGTTELKITGTLGDATITLIAGTTTAGIESEINSVADQTGIYASAVQDAVTNVAFLSLFSEDFGSDQTLQIEVLSGAINVLQADGGATSVVPTLTRRNTTPTAAAYGEFEAVPGALLGAGNPLTSADGIVTVLGTDAVVTFQGADRTANGANGREFSINTGTISFSFSLNPDQIIAGINTAARVLNLADNSVFAPGEVPTAGFGIFTISVQKSGLVFQVNEKAQPSDQIALAIKDVTASELGFDAFRDRIAEAVKELDLEIGAGETITKGGFLDSLSAGKTNSLETNPQNALDVVNAAIDEVTNLRGLIGAIQTFNIEPGINAVQVEVQNLSASLSSIRDLDFAEETSAFTRTQILFQSGIAVLASANLIPQSILTLLR